MNLNEPAICSVAERVSVPLSGQRAEACETDKTPSANLPDGEALEMCECGMAVEHFLEPKNKCQDDCRSAQRQD